MTNNPPPSVAVPARHALFLSFHCRKPVEGAGDFVAQNFASVVRSAFQGAMLDIFQNDPPGRREMVGMSVDVDRRSTVAMAWRLLTRGEIGRLRFRFRCTRTVSPPPATDLFIDGVGFAPVLRVAPSSGFNRTVVLHHNFEPDFYSDMYHGKYGAAWWTRAGFTAQRVAMQQASHNLFLTRQDLEKAQRAFGPGRGISVVFGVCEPLTARPEPRPVRDSRLRVLVTGTLGDRKGHLGLVEMLQAAVAQKSRLMAKMRFTIAGRDPTPELLALADQDFISVVANPASMDDIARDCDVYVNPNYTGSGIKMRNFDGLRHGLPVLCRTENAAGFDHLSAPVFQPFGGVDEGLERLAALPAATMRSAQVRQLVWAAYAEAFGLDGGVARLRHLLAAN